MNLVPTYHTDRVLRGESKNTHAICRACWDANFSGPVEPATIKTPDLEVCCNCGTTNRSGIYMRVRRRFELGYCHVG